LVFRRLSRWLPVLLGALCAVWALVMPRVAWANAGLCDSRGATVALPGPLACAEIAAAVGLDAAEVPGFCDLRGATAIAPMPALQGSDGVIDVATGCNDEIRSGTRAERRDAPSPLIIDASEIDRGAPCGLPFVPAARDAGAALFPAAASFVLPTGHGRGIEHPPRALAPAAVRPSVAPCAPVRVVRSCRRRP
jgi:hypothetical protein